MPAPWVAVDWPPTVATTRYSRRVALLKRILPAAGLALLLAVTAWPRLAPLLDRIRFSFPAIDLREARELQMLNPRFIGTDRMDRPFLVAAALGRQVSDRQDLLSLEAPRADMKTHGGANVVVTSVTGVYQSDTQLLDLFGNVNLVQEDGTRFVTNSARLDLANNTAVGQESVDGHGPSGDVAGQGFHISDKGDTVVVDGQSSLLAKSSNASTASAKPEPILPPAVARTADRVEAQARPAAAGTTKSPAAAKPGATGGHLAGAAAKPPAAKTKRLAP